MVDFSFDDLSDFINSVEAPTLGIISVAKGGSVSTSTGPQGTTLSASGSPGQGTFAPGTGSGDPGVASLGGVAGMMSRPGLLLLGLAAIVVVVAIAKS